MKIRPLWKSRQPHVTKNITTFFAWDDFIGAMLNSDLVEGLRTPRTRFVHSEAVFWNFCVWSSVWLRASRTTVEGRRKCGQRCLASTFLRAKCGPFVHICAEDFELGDEHRSGKLLVVNVWHEASRRKLTEVLHRSSQGTWIRHTLRLQRESFLTPLEESL